MPLNKGHYELTREEIRQVFARLYRDNGIRYLFVQGGEPLLRKDLVEILQDLAEMGYWLGLVTNGTLLTPSIIKRLARLPISISVSLDSLNRERYQSIRGADQLPQVLKGIAALTAFPHSKYVTCIVSERNRQDVLEVVRYARDNGFVPVVGAYHWGIERYGKVDLTLQYERAVAVNVFQQILASQLVPQGYFRRYLSDNIQWLEGKALDPCDAGRYSVSIDASGNVAPCYALQPSGNLLESSLEDILVSMNREAIKKCSENSSCNLLCSRIVGSTLRHPVSALITPKNIRTGHREQSHVQPELPTCHKSVS
ncbi:MAG: radical SAM protein [Nitrospirota bacterium]|nr:MAG: radical SAM protein [Nitrospirota bacterium]